MCRTKCAKITQCGSRNDCNSTKCTTSRWGCERKYGAFIYTGRRRGKKVIYLCFLPVLRRNIFFGPENLSRITCANVTIGMFPSKLKRVYKSIKVNWNQIISTITIVKKSYLLSSLGLISRDCREANWSFFLIACVPHNSGFGQGFSGLSLKIKALSFNFAVVSPRGDVKFYSFWAKIIPIWFKKYIFTAMIFHIIRSHLIIRVTKEVVFP